MTRPYAGRVRSASAKSWALAALGLITALLAPWSATAQGCGPTRLKVMESVVLELPPDKAWQLVGDFQDMRWARPRAVTDSGGNVPDHATRVLTLGNGTVLEESLYRYDAGARSYSYHIDHVDTAVLPVQNASATIEVVAEGGKSIVRWRAAFYRFLRPDEPAPDVADAQAAQAVTAFLREALEGLKSRGEAAKT